MDPFVIALVFVSALLHVAWNVRLKTAGDPLRAATVGMLAATVGIVPAGTRWPGGWAGVRHSPSRGSRSGCSPGSSRRATSSCCRRRTGGATCRSSIRSRAGRRRCWPWRSGSGLFGERLGVPGSVGVVPAARRLHGAPAAVAGVARRPSRLRPGDRVRAGDRRDDRDLQRGRSTGGAADPPAARTPRSCG